MLNNTKFAKILHKTKNIYNKLLKDAKK